MRKLKMDLDMLAVERFTTGSDAGRRFGLEREGTVLTHESDTDFASSLCTEKACMTRPYTDIQYCGDCSAFDSVSCKDSLLVNTCAAWC